MINNFFNSHSSRSIKKMTLLFFASTLAACGGGSDTVIVSSDGGSVSSSTSEYSLENIQLSSSDLSAGGSTGVSVELKDSDGDFVTNSQTVVFSSPCVASGLSELEPSITSETGLFNNTYTSLGCDGKDVITASYGDQKLTVNVNNQGANLGSIEVISVTPQNITMKGMSAPGLQHTSKIIFQAKNDVGGPIANAEVKFELTTEVGGISLSVTEAKTDNDGVVSTILQAGTVHTNVRVRATLEKDGVTISSESSEIVISTGVADQNSFSMSLSVHNPLSWEHDGESVDVNIRASDRYNNPVPDGTNIAFFTELGIIQPSCSTEDGACSVTWTSSNPRDLGVLDVRYPRSAISSYSDGISTITAMVIGEESFVDTNSNGIFDDGDQFDLLSDRGEMFEDYNKNYDVDGDGVIDNSYDEGLDPFIDYNGNGIRDLEDAKYTGLGCAHSTLCAEGNGLKHIYASAELVMAEENLVISSVAGSLDNPLRNGVTYTIEVFGIRNNQVPPAETEITVLSDQADVVFGGATIGSLNSHNSDLTNPSGLYTMQMRFADKDPETQENGTVEIKIDTAKGQSVSYFLNNVDNAVTPPSATP